MKSGIIMAIILLFASFATSIKAEEKIAEAQIKSPVWCEMCDETIQKGLKKISGISKVNVDLEKQIVTVTFDENETSIETIRRAISRLGYDADDVKADLRAYRKLPKCCKKPEDRK